MNKFLITAGALCSLLWAFVTKMSLGLPLEWCVAFDNWTFHIFHTSIMRMANGFYYDVENIEMPTLAFLAVFFVIFVLVFILFLRLEKVKYCKSTLWIIIFFAALYRILLLPSVLIHENDIYRYIWDGKTSLAGINPYKYAPTDLFMYENNLTEDYYDDYYEVTYRARTLDEKEQQQVKALIAQREENPVFFTRIGHRQVPTIYPPAAQLLFTFAAWVRPDSLLLLKVIFILFDIGVILLIVGLLKHFNRNPCHCIVYAWSPLVLKEFANSGHYDSLAIFFMMLALLLFVKAKRVASALALAVSTLSKFFSLVLLPFIAGKMNRRSVAVFGAVLLLFYLPYLWLDGTGISGVFRGFVTYNKDWFYNSLICSAIYSFLKMVLPGLAVSLWPTKTLAGLIYIFILFRLWKHPTDNDLDILHKCFLAVACLFLLNPVGDPWYFTWSIPLLCLFPYRSWILLSGMLILAYLNFRPDIALTEMKFHSLDALECLIYLPFLVLLCFEKSRLWGWDYRWGGRES